MALRWSLFAGVLLLALPAGSGGVAEGPAPRPRAPAIRLEPVVTGLIDPLYVTSAHDGTRRLFVLEQAGRVKVLQPGASVPTVLLDLTARVLSGGERGLLGIAFHPQFSTNRRFFVDYTRRPDGATVIAEYRVSASNPNVADTAETVLLTIAQPFANHNGGMVEFGPDGYLYIGMGDGGSGGDPDNRAQNPGDLLGKILRIDVDRTDPGKLYASPPSNPFFGSAAGRNEVYALGLRNPWRFSFDRETGDLYAGDVGQDAIEEIDVIRSGGNYGWRVMEGTRCYRAGAIPCNDPRLIPPIAEYQHSSSPARRCSVTGGYVYRGTRFALPLGSYVYGDYCSGEIFLLEGTSSSVLLRTALSITSFGEDEQGEIYVVGGGTSGTVHRLASVSEPIAATFYVPRLASTNGSSGSGDGSEYTAVALVNSGGDDATVRLTAYGTAGGLLSGAAVTNPAVVALGPGEQSALADSQIFGSALAAGNALGWLKVESTAAAVTGLFLAFNRSLTMLDGAALGGTSLRRTVLSAVEPRGFTRVHALNPGSSEAALTIELVNSAGVLRAAAASRAVKGGGVLIESLESLFPRAAVEASDYVRMESSQGIVPFEQVGRSGAYLAALGGHDAERGPGVLYAPQYAFGGPDWASTLSVVNLEDVDGSVTFELLGDDGSPLGAPAVRPIAARGKLEVGDPGFFGTSSATLVQGYVRVTSSGPRLAGSVLFGDPARAAFGAALPLGAASVTRTLFGQLASDGTYFTGVAVLNPGPASAVVTLAAFASGGAALAPARSVTLAAGARRSGVVEEWFPALAGQNRSSGYVRLTSDTPVAAFALFGTRDLSALSAIPAAVP